MSNYPSQTSIPMNNCPSPIFSIKRTSIPIKIYPHISIPIKKNTSHI